MHIYSVFMSSVILSRHHAEANEKLVQAHEAKLDELENYATRHANEIDGELYDVNNMNKERDSYLSRAQNWLDTI